MAPSAADWAAISQALTEDIGLSGSRATATAPTEEDRVAIAVVLAEGHAAAGSSSNATETDVARQRRPLHRQIRNIYREAGLPPPYFHLQSLDDEPGAPVFARLLSRLADAPSSKREDAAYRAQYQKILNDATEVINVIVNDPEFRAEVFAMAVNALGSCGDNVYKGFCDIMHATHIRRMQQKISSGQLRPQEFADWGRREFRLHKLHELVMTHIRERLNVTKSQEEAWVLKEEPLELVLHAEVQAGKYLQLPESACRHASRCFAEHMPETLVKNFSRATRKAEELEGELHDFLVSNPVWQAGLRKFDPADFEAITERFDNDPYYDEPLPTTLDEEFAYAAKAADLQQRRQAAEAARITTLTLHYIWLESLKGA